MLLYALCSVLWCVLYVFGGDFYGVVHEVFLGVPFGVFYGLFVFFVIWF